jgi:hypothetical protein
VGALLGVHYSPITLILTLSAIPTISALILSYLKQVCHAVGGITESSSSPAGATCNGVFNFDVELLSAEPTFINDEVFINHRHPLSIFESPK